MTTRVSNPTHAPLPSILFFFFISSFRLGYSLGNNTILCPEIEKQSLLNFKQNLKDPKNQLSSWDGEVNCCKWDGVVCNDFTGHVLQLRLRNMSLDGKLNSSLLNLKYLNYLDLSGNDLLGGTMPSFIGSFVQLEHLNLSGAGFHGKVPHTIGNLSNLHTLDLESFNQLVVDSLEWMTGLSQLEYLNMNGANLSKANNWAQVINSLPSLLELHFGSCSLDFMAPLEFVNMTSLQHLNLSDNMLGKQPSVTFMPWIFQLSNLLSINLSRNSFMGPIPTISNATKLQHIDLSSNIFINSSIPNWFYLCKDLKFVDLSVNLLSGTISSSIANLTSLNTFTAFSNQLSGKIPNEISNLCKIEMLDLGNNSFHGEVFGNMSECFLEALDLLFLNDNKLSGLSNQFGEFKSLRYLDLGGNSLSGVVPISILKLSSLEYLSLYENKFNGTLPESLGQLFNLRTLQLFDNMLEGIVTETHFANLTKLEIFAGGKNNLTLKVSPNWNPPFQLRTLFIDGWNLNEDFQILSWLEKQKNLENLFLSKTGISGNIPSWAWKLERLIMSNNHLHGHIRIPDTMQYLDLSNNSFSGDISHVLCYTTYQNSPLKSLHLGGNQLSGELPDCWIKWPSLSYLNLDNNNLSGSIPNSIGLLANLESLYLNGNRFSGEIPFLLHNCTALSIMNLADNHLDGGIPTWVGTHLVHLSILILRSNKLSGKISPEICLLNSLQILDLSNNKLSGIIPGCLSNLSAMSTKRNLVPFYYAKTASVAIKGSECQYGPTILSLVTNINLSKNNLSGNIPKDLTRLVELRSLNLSQNRLTGPIPEKIGDMKQLESLDLSMNFLSGQVPNSLALVSFLSYLNLSCNNLTGKIPKSAQLQSLNTSSFNRNNLCGPPLTIKCRDDGDEGREYKEENEEEEEEEESKIEWLYVVVSSGYAVGFSAVCSALVMKKSWREAYFGLLVSLWDKLYVYVCIKSNKLSARVESG